MISPCTTCTRVLGGGRKKGKRRVGWASSRMDIFLYTERVRHAKAKEEPFKRVHAIRRRSKPDWLLTKEIESKSPSQMKKKFLKYSLFIFSVHSGIIKIKHE